MINRKGQRKYEENFFTFATRMVAISSMATSAPARAQAHLGSTTFPSGSLLVTAAHSSL
jgi:hypothetical protein